MPHKICIEPHQPEYTRTVKNLTTLLSMFPSIGDGRRYPVTTSEASMIHWRIGSCSGNNGTCVEVAALPTATSLYATALTHPDGAMTLFTRVEINHWIQSHIR